MTAALPEALRKPEAYRHAVGSVDLIETHMSWVFLAGPYAYKVKKPVRFDFADFSEPAVRRQMCETELALNRNFAAELYLDVVPICEADGHLMVGGDGPAVEWAVQMRRFDPACTADRLVEQGALDATEVRAFAARLAGQHAALPLVRPATDALAPMLDNFTTLAGTPSASPWRERLQALQRWTQSEGEVLQDVLAERGRTAIRECHGDLHLGNIVRLADGLSAFDCLEFDVGLRQIDTMGDVAFMFMDLCVRGRKDLAYAFADAYMDGAGDYAGLAVLNLYANYRAMVRAKVAALRLEQSGSAEAERELERDVAWMEERVARPVGRLLVTCGLSGSGKSFWARQLAEALGAVRLRSDIMRKSLAGLAPDARSGASVAGGPYDAQSTADTYAALARLAGALLKTGETVIVDAANLRLDQRRCFARLADHVGAGCTVLHFTAPEAVLRERILQRAAEGGDPSEADEAVLAWQMAHAELPQPGEASVCLDTSDLDLPELLARIGETAP